MDVLLIRPFEQENINIRLPESIYKVQGIFPPLGLSYIASVLKKNNIDVEILDIPALNLTKAELNNLIAEKKPFLVGISCMSTTLHSAYEVAKLAKENKAFVIIGGPHLAAYPKETLLHDFIDFGSIGEAEFIILELIHALKKKKSHKSIKGLAYKEKGNIKINSYRIVHNLDSLPFPARNLLPMDKYDCVITQKPFTTMMTSRGCPFQCGFCFKQPSDKRYRLRNVNNVIAEMQHCIEKYKVKEIMFYDDSFTFNKNFVIQLCNEIIKKKIKINWEAPTRVNNIDDNLLKLMKKAGCIRLRYGVESGNQRVLNLMKKGITLEQVKRAFRITKQNKIETFAYFMIGYATETEKTMNNTIDLAKKLNPDWVMFTATTPLPNTELFDMAVKQNLVSKNYWRDYTLDKKTKRIPYFVKDADKWVQKAYRKFYLRPGFILNKIFSIRDIGTIKKYINGAKGIVLFNMQK